MWRSWCSRRPRTWRCVPRCRPIWPPCWRAWNPGAIATSAIEPLSSAHAQPVEEHTHDREQVALVAALGAALRQHVALQDGTLDEPAAEQHAHLRQHVLGLHV